MSDIDRQVRELVSNAIIIDTHLDVPYRLNRSWADVSQETAGGNFDYPRAVAGGLDVAFLAAYTAPGLEAEGGSRELAERLIDIVEKIVRGAPEKFAHAYGTEDIRDNFARGLISLPIAMENGAPLGGDLNNLHHFYQCGVRYVTLCHNGTNHICDSSRDEPRWNGLSDFGRELVQEMNRIGMMVDVSHASDKTFWDVLELSGVPVIASHSSARHFTPGFGRNLADDMIVALAGGGGVVMINFGSAFLKAAATDFAYARWDAWAAHLSGRGMQDSKDEEERFMAAYEAEHGPFPFADLGDALDHFDHVVSLVGAEHVGFGSDFDGLGDTLPTGLKDVSCYPALIRGLLERGHSKDDVRKIAGENLLRLWGEVEANANRPA